MIIVQEILLDFLYDQEKSLVKFNKVNEGNPVNKRAALLILEKMVTEHMSREKADEFLKFQHEVHESLNGGRPMNMHGEKFKVIIQIVFYATINSRPCSPLFLKSVLSRKRFWMDYWKLMERMQHRENIYYN